jgi:Kdo2-lipid IVA lauroyltransferase/acyltransferase
MAKTHSRCLDFLVYLVVRLLVCVIQAVPLEMALGFAGFLARLAYRIDRRHREAARENLQHAFGADMNDTQRDQVVRSVYSHFCRLLMEIMFLPRRMRLHNWRRFVTLKGQRLFVDYLLSGRPLLIVTGHFGNWEMAGYTLGLLGFRTNAVARPLDNPYLDDFLRSFRERTGQRLLAKKGDFDQMQEILSHGGILATLADQDAGQRGLFVDFFGRPASTHKAMALLALEYSVPIIVSLARNLGQPLCYEMATEEVILPEEYQGRPDAVRALSQRFTAALERGIRRAPDQYFWLHRRWKHQPARLRGRAA